MQINDHNTSASRQEQIIAWTSCILIALVSSVLASPDSPFTHNETGRVDNCWFMDAGRWLMSGLTPYVDFADSKGPFLWLWYGLGYLLDPYGWKGMFVLWTVYYTAVLRVIWSAARILTGSDRGTLFTVIVMPVAYYAYMSYTNTENRAEDLVQLPLAFFIYIAIKSLSGLKISDLHWWAAGIGLGFVTFVKWNYPVMMFAPVLVAAIFALRGTPTRNVLNCCGRVAAGFVAVTAVVLVWMGLSGSLEAMFDEYVLNTLRTTDEYEGFGLTLILWRVGEVIKTRAWYDILLVCIIYVSLRKFGRRGWWLTGCFVWMWCLMQVHYQFYYDEVLASYMMFGPVAAVLLLPRLTTRSWVIAAEAVCICAFILFASRKRENFGHKPFVDDYRAMTARVAELEQPRILYYGKGDYGLGIKSHGLPGARYWATQEGCTPQMRAVQQQAMEEHRADVVMTVMNDTTPAAYGYRSAPGDTMPSPWPSKNPAVRVWWLPEAQR